MDKFYFTFGSDHPYSNQVQVIVAPDMKTATEKMFELFGRDWAIDYTEKQWIEVVERGSMQDKVERDYVYCGDQGMSVGEMQKWTERYLQIIGGAQTLVKKRLKQLLNDLYDIHGHEDDFANRMMLTIEEVI